MPSTYLSLHYHIIFSTKDRIRHIHKDWRNQLHAYLGGIVRELAGIPECIGGVEDHIHMLIGLRATHSLAYVMKQTKGSSSLWVHNEIKNPLFSWQEGYAGFSVSASQLQNVREYIMRQEEHHKHRSFQDEYVQFLESSGIEYDEKYLW